MMSSSSPKAVFIEPKPPNPHIFSLYALPRLGSVLLATLLKDAGWEVTVYVEEVSDIDYTQVLNADLVGISTITSTAPRAYAIADEIWATGIPVVLGGAHVTWLPEEGLEHADMVVRGEGEVPIMRLADCITGKGRLESVPGLSYRREGTVVHNPLPEPVKMEELPTPDLSLIHGYFGKGFPSTKVIPVQTTRGCPFECNFCSVTGMFGRRLRRRSIDSITTELRVHSDAKALAFFYDDNFTADRKHAREVCRGIIDANLDLRWSAQVRLDLARDPELLELMYKAGCRTLFIGFESVNPDALAECGKSQSAEDMVMSVKTIRQAGIDVHGMFIFGFDSDKGSDIEATVDFTRSASITTAQFLLLTPFPGTDLYDRFCSENRILSSDWNLYDGHHVVFRPSTLDPLRLQESQLKAHDLFYSWPRSLRKFFKGRISMAGIYAYARRNNTTWKRLNREYMTDLRSLYGSHPGS